MPKTLAIIAIAFTAILGLSGCAEPAAPVTSQIDLGTVIDVRTPEEFAQGHLTGAINVDVQSATFDQEIQQLPTSGTYTLYCRSGNRAGAALSQMQKLGFADLTNVGGLEQAAAATGLSIVTGP